MKSSSKQNSAAGKRQRDADVPVKLQPTAGKKAATPVDVCSGAVVKPAVSIQGRLPGALLVVGTYHSVMAGLALRSAATGVKKSSDVSAPASPAYKFFLKFSIKHHVGCISNVAVCDRYIASCGTDERLFLFTVKDRGGQLADLGSLAPASEVRTLTFHGNHHLICGCIDGTVNVYRTRDWESILAVQVHEKAVESLAMHPNGALLVTVGLDRFVSMLDMTSGKLITKMKLGGTTASGVPTQIIFSADPSAAYFAVVLPYEIHVFETRNGSLKGKYIIDKKPPNEIHCATFVCPTSTSSSSTTPEASMTDLPTVHLQYLVLGTEAGKLLSVRGVELLDPTAEPTVISVNKREARIIGVPEDIVASQASIKDETKKKYPTCHATRVKTLSVLPGTTDVVLSADTNGALLATRLETTAAAVGAHEEEVVMRFQCSANCQGRVTSVAALSR
jgi:hypothetical protein